MNKIPYSFMKGMNRDIAKNKFPKEAYYYMENGRILSSDDSTTSNIVSVRGNSNANILDTEFNPSSREGFVIIGHCTILDNIVLFYAEENSTIDSTTTTSCLDVLEYRGNDEYQRREVWKGLGLNFRSDKPIRAVSNYSKPTLQKLYWTDNNNITRHCNIGEDISLNSVSKFDFIGDFNSEYNAYFRYYTSGNLKQGVIFYAYRLVDLNNNKTNFSQLSNPIYIAKNVFNEYNAGGGDDIYDPDSTYNTGIGVGFTIYDNQYFQLYDYIEVASLWMSSKTGTPTIVITNKINITGISEYSIVDEGTSNYGTLELSEFLNQTSDFKAKDISIKDNRLFFSNITEKNFDLDEELGYKWDARAYRFSNSGNAYLFKKDDELGISSTPEYTLTLPNPDYNSVSEIADCINIYNQTSNLSGELDTYNSEICDLDTSGEVGGEGLNIKYKFNYYVDTELAMSTTDPGIYVPIKSGYDTEIMSLQRDEVYRVGITFFDNKGRQSFVKWIGDIRVPSTSPFMFYDRPNKISLEFTLKNMPQLNGAYLDYQIVYVKRESKDKSVVFSGLAEDYYNYDNLGTYRPKPSLNLAKLIDINNDSPTAIISPEINFNKDKFLNIDYFETIGLYQHYVSMWKDSEGVNWTIDTTPNHNIGIDQMSPDKVITVKKLREVNVISRENRFKSKTFINQIKTFPPTSYRFVLKLGTVTIANSIFIGTGVNEEYYTNAHGTCMVYDDNLPVTSSEGYYHVYGRKRVFYSQYGGLGYEERLQNTYIPMSIKTRDSVVQANKGDIFISIFEYGRCLSSPTSPVSERSKVEWLYFPVETQINLPFRFDDTYYRNWDTLGTTGPYYINEDAFVGPVTGIQYTGLYQYNHVYSSINTINKFFPKPLNFNQYSKHETMIKYSDVKLGDDDYDKWLEFRTNNYNIANKSYGEINKIVEFNDRLFAFQNNAVSIVSVNPRVTQVSDDGVTISLGTGEVIDSFKYLTTDIGCQDNSDVVKSLSAMYWLDKNKKKIYSFGEGMSSITDMKGMHSYLKNNVSENSKFIGTYDIDNSEVLMTITDDYDNTKFIVDELSSGEYLLFNYGGDITEKELLLYDFVLDGIYLIEGAWCRFRGINNTLGVIGFYFDIADGSKGSVLTNNQIVSLKSYIQEKDNFTISFNEKLQAFTSFYSFIPTLYIYHNKGFFSSNNNLSLWQHDISMNYNEFYGEYSPLRLTIILNNINNQGEYTNLTFYSTVEDSNGVDYRNETITDIYTKNKYQQSEIVKLYPKSLSEEGSNGNKYVLDTSSTKIGYDFYPYGPGLNIGDLVAYKGELYRNLFQGNTLNPEDFPDRYEIAELCNIRKVIEEWNTQIPRIIPEYDLIIGTKHSDRSSGDFVELTILFDKPYTKNKKISLSDLKVNSYSIPY